MAYSKRVAVHDPAPRSSVALCRDLTLIQSTFLVVYIGLMEQEKLHCSIVEDITFQISRDRHTRSLDRKPRNV